MYLTASPNSAPFAGLPPEYAIPERAPSLREAQEYCRRLAGSHYENFSVATWFLPKRVRPHFYSVYAYCRISDDLGDEVGDPHQALRLLDEWESELNATYLSLIARPPLDIRRDVETLVPETPVHALVSPRHPVFIALRETILQCDIPREPFADLLKAFRQDQTVGRYETFDDVLGYCHYSANPVGRLVLYACGYRDEYRQQLSDYTCTALQLANFWQDVVPDYARGRIYLPLEDMRRFGVSEQDLADRRFGPAFAELMRFEVDRAEELFRRGEALLPLVDGRLRIDVALYGRGGRAILGQIRAVTDSARGGEGFSARGKPIGRPSRTLTWRGRIRQPRRTCSLPKTAAGNTCAPVSSAIRPTPRRGVPRVPLRMRVPSGKMQTVPPRSTTRRAVSIVRESGLT
jgi:squalene synthase HpnC